MVTKHYREQVNILLAKAATAKQRVKEEKQALSAAQENLEAAEQASSILQQVAQNIQQQAHQQIASVVTRCLQAVFAEEAYRFHIEFERKRGRTEARLAFFDGENELHPRSATGGGVLDVASFALRLASLMLARPRMSRILILDEPFRNLHSPIFRERVRVMLESLAEELGFQFIMATGIDDLHTGKVIVIKELEQ
jgi:DNA repair exonuclease SbcCD ATPase subunit